MEDRTEQSHNDSEGHGRTTVSRPLSSILDTVRHPIDANAVLEWAMMLWDESPTTDLIVITNLGDAAVMDNRLRVKLSTVRKTLKYAKAYQIKRFGFTSTYFAWTLENGEEREALCLSRKVLDKHTMLEAFDSILGEKK